MSGSLGRTKSLTAKLNVSHSWTYSDVPGVGSGTIDNNAISYSESLANGSGAEQSNLLFYDERVVSAATPNDDLNLFNVLKDCFGDILSFAKVKAVIIQNLNITSGDKLLVGAAGTNPWTAPFNGSATAVLVCGPKGTVELSNPVDGLTVSNGSSQTLRVAYSGSSGSITYAVAVIGN